MSTKITVHAGLLAITVGIGIAAVAAARVAAFSQELKPLPQIKITDPKDVASVRAVQDTLGTLSEKVTACVTAGGSRESCLCTDPKQVTQLRTGYAALLKEHAAWKDQILSYQYLQDGRNMSGVLVMKTLQRQLDVLKCE